MFYNKKKGLLEQQNFNFLKESEFKKAQLKLDTLNMKQRKFQDRHLCVFVNPISGNQQARNIYTTVLKPMLEFTEIIHTMHETESETYIQDFVDKLDISTMSYTEFIVIGGDGVFGQLINAIMSRPDYQLLKNLPIGLMPGGSANSL